MAVATTLQAAFNDSQDANFIGRVSIALEVECYAVILEAATTPNHAERLAYAKQVTNGDPIAYGRKLAMGMVANGISAASSDPAILGMIHTGFGVIAGIGQ